MAVSLKSSKKDHKVGLSVLDRRFFLSVIVGLGLTFSSTASAKAALIAVTANFSETAKNLAQAFERKTGDHIDITQGATGALFTQIENGAPFEVFFSADSERPAKLVADGFAIEATRRIYADGRLVLWSAKPGYVDAQGAVLGTRRFDHLALADPMVAPYGAAAMEVLKSRHLDGLLQAKLVKGSSVTQAYAFVKSGAAELGFVALSQVIGRAEGSQGLVPQALYRPLHQEAVLLKTGADNPTAKAFLDYVSSEAGRKIIAASGYGLPQ